MFAISLPLIYGEGRDKAFSRFQGMLIQQYDDDSILAWQEAVGPNTQRCWPILALSVKSFMHSGGIRYRSSLDGQQSLNRNRSQMDDSMRGFAVTNLGLRISRELLSCTNRNDISILKLQCYPVEDPEGFLGLSLWTEDNSRVPGPMVQTVQKGKNPIWKAAPCPLWLRGDRGPCDDAPCHMYKVFASPVHYCIRLGGQEEQRGFMATVGRFKVRLEYMDNQGVGAQRPRRPALLTRATNDDRASVSHQPSGETDYRP
jgi:hypothetical protein